MNNIDRTTTTTTTTQNITPVQANNATRADIPPNKITEMARIILSKIPATSASENESIHTTLKTRTYVAVNSMCPAQCECGICGYWFNFVQNS